MISESPPRDRLPREAPWPLVLLVRTRTLLVGVHHFCVWPEGLRFTVAVRLRDGESARELRFNQYDVVHEGQVEFDLAVHLGGVRLSGFGSQKQGGYSLHQHGGTGAFGPTEVGSWDIHWWLTPLPTAPFKVSVCSPELDLPETGADIDATGIDRLAQETIRFG